MTQTNRPPLRVPCSGLTRTSAAVRATATTAVILCGLLALAGGCRRESAAGGSPKSAAKAYLQAMVGGDVAGVRAASVGDEASAQLLAAQAVKNAATERYVAAAGKRYGSAAVADALVGRRGDDHEANVLARIDAEPESVKGDEAVVGQGRVKLYLVKVGGDWKVDRQRQVPPAFGDPGRYTAEADAIRRAYDTVTADVEAGKLATPAEAKAALLMRTAAELQPLAEADVAAAARKAPAATGPGTVPIR